MGNLDGNKNDFEILQEEKKIKDFDDILESIGGEGRFQKLFLYGFVTPFTMVSPIFIMNWIFVFSVPDHWCHVPGRPNGTDLETWKNLTIPVEAGSDGLPRLSQCSMFGKNGSIVQCEAWDYDKSDYEETLPSEYNWVCDKSRQVADVFSIIGFGNLAGAILLGIAADKFGRKPVLFISMATFFVFTMAAYLLAQYFTALLVLKFLAGFSYPFVFSTICTMAAELSGTDYRAWTYSVIWMVWVIGNSALPLIAYLLRSWFTIGVVTLIPSILFVLYYKFVPESPRWLLSTGKTKEAAKVIQQMARINGKTLHQDLNEILGSIVEKGDGEVKSRKSIGVWTLFTKPRLARNTILLCMTWALNELLYYGLTLNTTQMSGNEFFNYLLLSIIELPAGWLGGVLVERTGRRWTQALFFGLSAASFSVASWFCLDPSMDLVVLVAALCAKFAVSVTSLICYLQRTEIFPTNLRSTGIGFVCTVSSAVGTAGPYIIYLARYHASIPYAAFTLFSLVGALSSVFLPETLHQSLPETIEDANQFGQTHKFWSFLPTEPKAKQEGGENQ